MALFGKKKKAEAAPADGEDQAALPPAAVVPEEDGEEGVALAVPAPKKEGVVALLIPLAVVTALAIGGGFGLGKMTSAGIAAAIAAREAAKPPEDRPLSIKYSGDTVLKPIDAVVTNLAQPTDVWIRLETAMVFKNGALPNPEVTAAEIRQDIVAYARTVTLAQLEGPSALQHLRDDLNERASLRTNGEVSELLIQTLVVQ
jgi:flagellar FliL protein